LKILKARREETIIGLLAIGTYIVCLINDFHTDDWIVLSFLRDGFSLSDFLSMENPGRFRPLTNILLYFRYLVFVDTPFPYYTLNVILHAAVSIMLYRFLLKIEIRPTASFLSALIFATYFQHYEAVIWLYGIIRELTAIFYILCLWHLHNFVVGESKKSFWLFAVFSFLGLFVVEDFVVAPLAFPVFVLLFAGRGRVTGILKPVIISSVIVLLIYFSLRTALIARPGVTEQYYYFGSHMFRVLFDYIGWFVVPSPEHTYFQSLAARLNDPIFYVWKGANYLAMVGLIPFLIWLYIKSPKPVRFFILLIPIMFLPILPLEYKVGPRNIYPPSLAVAVIAGYIFHSLIWNRGISLWLRRTCLAALLIYIGISMVAINIASLEYHKTQVLVADIIEDLRESGVDFNQYKFTLFDNLPGRAIIGPSMMYKMDYERYVFASNDALAGSIDIRKKADSLYNENVPIIVFDYRDGHMVEVTSAYIPTDMMVE
jgi:hypothetical protein